MDEIYLTKDGYHKLLEELEFLKNAKRREIARTLAEARAHGDLSENAEYDAAKEAQAHNEQRIAELEYKLSRVHVLDDMNISADEVLIGAKVKLQNVDTGDELEYTLVSEVEADFEQRKISVTSPVGKGLVGHKENEIVEIKIPAGILRYKVLKISR